MRLIYFIFLGLAVALSLILAIPVIGHMAFFLWIMVSLLSESDPNLILYTPTTVIWLLGLMPLVLIWDNPSRRWLGILAAVALPAAILFIPAQLAKSQLKNAIRNTPQQDATPLDITPIKGVEIQRGVRPGRDLYQGRIFSRRLCGELCEQLLFGGDVDWVRVRLSNDTFNNKQINSSALFVRTSANTCQGLHRDMPDDEPCILYQNDPGDPAQLVITLTEKSGPGTWEGIKTSTLRQRGIRQLRATLNTPTGSQPVFSRSQLFYSLPRPVVQVELSVNGFGPWTYLRENQNTPNIDAARQLRGLGLQLSPPRSWTTRRDDGWFLPPEPWLTAQITSLADSYPRGDAPQNQFATAKRLQIGDWLNQAKTLKTFTPGEARLLCLIRTDPRFEGLARQHATGSEHGPVCPG